MPSGFIFGALQASRHRVRIQLMKSRRCRRLVNQGRGTVEGDDTPEAGFDATLIVRSHSSTAKAFIPLTEWFPWSREIWRFLRRAQAVSASWRSMGTWLEWMSEYM